MINLIGINGRINSGKSTVAKIIQYLSWQKELDNSIGYNTSYEEYLIQKPNGYSNIWEIRKFADKLKDIICILIGCTREDLESQEFKNKELGEDWWVWKLNTEEDYKTSIKSYEDSTGTEDFKLIKYSPRLLLQTLGTELFRNQLHSDVWVNSTFNDYKDIDLYRKENPLYPWKFPNWIIDDMRFKNEYEAIKSRGGLTIRVIRHGISTNNHESETHLDKYSFDIIINNNGSLEDLIIEVKNCLIKFNVI